MARKKIASIEIQNRDFYISPVLSFLDSLTSRHTAMDLGRYHKLRYIVGEMLKARVDNAYPGSLGTIWVEFYLADSYFEVSIRDKGIPSWVDFRCDEQLDIRNSTQMRNYLLDLWTDDIGMEKLGKEGQRLYVRMNILNRLVFKTPEPYKETVALDTDITIKPVQTEAEAIEAIRCIYSEYGYSYSYEKLYYPESFMHMLQNGELMSFLAVNAHGQVAGHFALAFSDTFPNMPEISTVVTRKEFRGLGLFAKFMNYCMELGKEKGFRALMGQPVAFHPLSQKAFLRSGFTPTAVLLAYIPPDIESEYNKEKRRLDLFASVKLLDSSAQSVIYPPKAIRPFAEKIYKELGITCALQEASCPTSITQISIQSNQIQRSTKIVLKSGAEDLPQVLISAVQEAIRRKHEMIELFLSLNDESCPYCYEIAQKQGFFFSGLMPGGENTDYLLLQLLIGNDAQYEQLVTVGSFEDLKQIIVEFNSKNGGAKA